MYDFVVSEIDVTDGLSYDPTTGVVYRSGRPVGTPDRDGYLRVRYHGALVGCHQVAWMFDRGFLRLPDEIDHRDRNKRNNRWSNLADSNRVANNLNVGVRIDNTSGLKGVGFHAAKGKWRARARRDGKRHELGYFDTKEEAYAAYLAFDPTRAA